jgi:hypothetical protein
VPITVTGTLAGLQALRVRVDDATQQVTADAAHIVQTELMKSAPVGTPGNSTNAPGDLKRSMDVQGPFGFNGRYLATVGPTVIYGRQRALGGDIYPKMARSLVFTKFGTTIYTMHVAQGPNLYMEEGEAASLPLIPPVVEARMTAAILGG